MSRRSTRNRAWVALRRAAALGCPRCGARTLFRGLFAMEERCACCDLLFEREPGYFVGAIYINYAVTAILTMGGFLLLDAYVNLKLTTQLLLWGIFSVTFPLLFFRYSKSLWLAVDYLLDPQAPKLRSFQGRRG